MASFFFIDDHPARAGQKNRQHMAPTQAVPVQARPHQTAPHPLNETAEADWAPSSTFRKEVQPPSLFARSQPRWRQWIATAWHWLWDDEDLEDHPRVLQGLNQVKTEFLAVVWDLQSYTATHTRESIGRARSLRELWHLRADLFRVIAIHRGQAEAQRRLSGLDRHFPVRITAGQTPAGKVSDW